MRRYERIAVVALCLFFQSSLFGQNSPSTTGTILTLRSGGASSTTSMGPNGSQQAGYATATIHGDSAPYSTAVFSYQQNGVTVTETGVPASPPTTSARIFIDYRTAVNAVPGRSDAGTIDINTGIGIVNSGSNSANVTYTLRDLNGVTLAVGHGTIAKGNHFACFINQLNGVAPDFNLPSNFQSVIHFGTLDITSDQPLAVLDLRGANNQRNEFLLTTTPIADLTKPLGNSPIYFPQLADGDGYTTSIILLNTSDTIETGTLRILNTEGLPLIVNQVEGTTSSSFRYSIPSGGAFRFQTDGSPANSKTGWVVLTPDSPSPTPIGSGVFSYNPGSVLVSESGIPATLATTHARVYVDLSGNHNTGLAIANVNDTDTSITINAFQNDGITSLGTSQGPLQLVEKGQASRFANQFISGLPTAFTGVLEISSSKPFAAITIRSLYNERGDFLLTTFPIADANRAAPTPIVFPQIADGGGYQTQFIFLSPSTDGTAALECFGNSGSPMALSSLLSFSTNTLQTTKSLDLEGRANLEVSADGSNLIIPSSSQTAQSLAVGDVLAVGITPSTPNGSLRKVVSLSQNGSQVIASTTQANLMDAFDNVKFSFKTTFTGENVQTAKALRSGVKMLFQRKERFTKADSQDASSQIPCESDTIILVKMFEAKLIDDEKGSITASGEIRICPTFQFDFDISSLPPKLNSLTALTTIGESIHVNITGEYSVGFDKKIPIGVIASPIPVGPLVLTPTITFFVGVSGDLNAGFSVGATQTASVTGGLTYDNGQLTRIITDPTVDFGLDPFAIDATLTAKAYAGVDIGLNIEGILTPEFSPDAFLKLDVTPLANPWWTLSAGLEGDASVHVGLFGIVDLVDFEIPDLFSHSEIIAQADGGFIPSKAAPVLSDLNPSAASAGSAGMTLTLSGSNFVPGAVVKFNGNPLETFVVNPTQIKATLTGANLASAGTFPVSVINRDAPSTPSNSLNFIVNTSTNPTLAISSLSPSSAAVGSGPTTLTINGSGFISSSTVTYNGVSHTPSFVNGNQLTITLSTADLSTAGNYAVVVTNPSPSGGQSNAANFVVQSSGSLGLSRVVNGILSTSSAPGHCNGSAPAERWPFSITVGTTITNDVSSTVFDTYVCLLDANNNAISYDDNSGPGTNARLVYRDLPIGNYYIEVSSRSNGHSGGSYTLSLQPGYPPGTPIGLGQTLSGNLSTTGAAKATNYNSGSAADRYAFSITASTTITIDANSTAFNTYVCLLNASNNVISYDDNSGPGTNARLIYGDLPIGNYYIEVSSKSNGYSGGPYTLSLQPGYPPGTPIGLRQTLSGNLSTTGAAKATSYNSGSAADRYAFSITASTTITIDTSSTAFNTYVCLLNASNNVISYDDNSGPGTNARLIYADLPIGNYYIEVSSKSNGYSGGPYTLSFQPGYPPGTPIGLGQTLSGNLSTTGAAKATSYNSGSAADRYAFSITASTTITIDASSTVFNTYICLLNASNNVISYDDNSGPGTNARLIYGDLPIGNYYIEVSSKSNGYSGGPYTLSLQPGYPPGTPIGMGQTLSGNLSTTGAAKTTNYNSGSAADRYAFSITVSTTITIDASSTAFNTYVCLLDANNNVIRYDDDSGGGTNARLTYQNLPVGNYYIEVSSKSNGYSGGPYTIQLH
jgi:hypothetical protein